MTPNELRAAIATVASGQHGLIRARDLRGLEPRQLRRLAATGYLNQVAPGVYRLAGTPTTWLQHLTACAWALGPRAVVSHAAAAQLWELDRFDGDPLAFTVPRSERRRGTGLAGTTIHSTTLALRDVRRRRGLPLTSPERTMLDLAAVGTPQDKLGAAIDSALRARLTTLDKIIDRRSDSRDAGRRGLLVLDKALLDAGGHTVLERAFLRLVRTAGLPAAKPQVVHRYQGRHVARVDFLFVEHALVVEVSGGRGHSSPNERAKDARRRNELQQMGRTVLEFTYEQVTQRGPAVIQSILVSMAQK